MPWGQPRSEIHDVDCVRVGSLNWELQILVEIAVINLAWFVQAIPWAGIFTMRAVLSDSADNFSINSATVMCAPPMAAKAIPAIVPQWNFSSRSISEKPIREKFEI